MLALNADTALEPGCVGAPAASARGRPRPRRRAAADPPARARAGRRRGAPRALQRRPGADRRRPRLRGGGGGAAGCREHLRARARSSASAAPPACCGASSSRELGGYDESYFAFYEDVDLNVRARIAGWRFAYVPEAVVWHVGNASWQAGLRRPGAGNARLVARNRLATQVKFMPATALPRIAAVEAGALARASPSAASRATLRGKLEALRWLPALLRERRRLAARRRPQRGPRLARRSAKASPQAERRREALARLGLGRGAAGRRASPPAAQAAAEPLRGAVLEQLAGADRALAGEHAQRHRAAGPSPRSGAACSRGSSRCGRTWRRSPAPRLAE